MPESIERIVSRVLGVPAESVGDETSPDTLATWDSMAHLNLITAIESEYTISLTPEEAMEMLSVKLIRIILQDRGIT